MARALSSPVWHHKVTWMDPHCAQLASGVIAALNALDEGADPNLADADGYNPLIFAVIIIHWFVARLIGADA